MLSVGLVGGSVLTGSAATTTASTFVPITPCRLIDTRPETQVGQRSTPIAAQETYVASVRGANGRCDIPSSATGVTMNVAIVNPTAPSFLAVFPADATNPGTANLNWVAGQAPTPNAVTVALSADGRLALYNLAGTVDIAADVVGYFTPGGTGPQGPVGPQGPAGSGGSGNRLTDAQIALLQWWQDPGADASFAVGSNPRAVAFDGTYLWVVNSGDDTVSKINPDTGAVIGTYSTGDAPYGVAFDGTSIWVANWGANTVSKIDPATGGTMATYPTGNRPYGIAFDGTSIWVANDDPPGPNTVSKINTTTGARTDYPVGVAPVGVAFDGASIWVTNAGSNTVSKLNPTTGATLGTYPTGNNPSAVAFDGTWIWVTNYLANTVSKILPSTGATLATYTTGASPSGVAYDGTSIWVVNQSSNTVSKINPITGTKVDYPTGASPVALAYDGTSIWVTNNGPDTVSRVNAH